LIKVIPYSFSSYLKIMNSQSKLNSKMQQKCKLYTILLSIKDLYGLRNCQNNK